MAGASWVTIFFVIPCMRPALFAQPLFFLPLGRFFFGVSLVSLGSSLFASNLVTDSGFGGCVSGMLPTPWASSLASLGFWCELVSSMLPSSQAPSLALPKDIELLVLLEVLSFS